MPTADGECSMLAEEQGWRHFWNLDTWPFSLKQKSAGTDPRQSRGGETAGSFRLFPDECFCNMFASHSWFKQHDLCWVYKATPTKTHSALKHGWRSNKIKSTVWDKCETWEESLLFLWTAEKTAVRWPSTFNTPHPEGPPIYTHMEKTNTKTRFHYLKQIHWWLCKSFTIMTDFFM